MADKRVCLGEYAAVLLLKIIGDDVWAMMCEYASSQFDMEDQTMTNQFIPQVHEYVVYPGAPAPEPIIHAPRDRVWVAVHFSQELGDRWTYVGDQLNDGRDCDGTFIVSIPQDECCFYTEDEAESIHACMAVDSDLLRYAVG